MSDSLYDEFISRPCVQFLLAKCITSHAHTICMSIYFLKFRMAFAVKLIDIFVLSSCGHTDDLHYIIVPWTLSSSSSIMPMGALGSTVMAKSRQYIKI